MIIQVKFKRYDEDKWTAGPYSFQCNCKDVAVGDLAICDTRYGYNLGKVSKINVLARQNADIIPTKEVVAILSVVEYEKRAEDERKRREKIIELEMTMRSMFAQHLRSVELECMAEQCPALKPLYAELKKLKGNK